MVVLRRCRPHDERGRRSGTAGGEVFPVAPRWCMDPLDALALDLRERLLAGAGEEDGADLPERIRTLVDREAGVLSEERRSELAARIAQRAFGLGPLEP